MTTLLENITQPINQWYQGSSIRAFVQWWTSELQQLLPEQYSKKLFPKTRTVFINQGDQETPQLWRYQEDEFNLLVDDPQLQDKEWWHHLNHFIAGSEVDVTITYMLANKHAIVRNVTLPAAAMSDVDSVLTFELDKYVPFQPDEVVFAWRLGPVDEGSEKVLILLAVIKKGILDNILEAINSKGVMLTGVDINMGSDEAPKPLGVNLLPATLRKKKDWSKWKLYGGLSLAVLLLLSLVMYNSLENKRTKINVLNDQVELLRKDARRAKMLENQLNESITAYGGQFSGAFKTANSQSNFNHG